ncbi:MAG: hypothetical protein VX720_06055 [Pseudomonadota bacterium]|nr:hypothetical protein [Pseudomonadota bacterium]
MKMFLFLKKITLCILLILVSCTNQVVQEIPVSENKLNTFSDSIETLITNRDNLKSEILKINATSPSIQRILNLSDDFWIKVDIKRTNSELERALRLSKTESAVYLRLAHLRLEQDLLIESKSFSSRGLMNTTISSWEKFLLNIYQELE